MHIAGSTFTVFTAHVSYPLSHENNTWSMEHGVFDSFVYPDSRSPVFSLRVDCASSLKVRFCRPEDDALDCISANIRKSNPSSMVGHSSIRNAS